MICYTTNSREHNPSENTSDFIGSKLSISFSCEPASVIFLISGGLYL